MLLFLTWVGKCRLRTGRLIFLSVSHKTLEKLVNGNITKFLSKVFFFIEQLWWLVTSGFQGCRKRSVSWNQYLEFYHLICFKIWNIDPFYIDPNVSTSEWYRPNEKNFTYSCLGLGGPLFQEYSTFSRASHQRCSFKKGILKISQSSQENTSVGLSLQIKLQT